MEFMMGGYRDTWRLSGVGLLCLSLVAGCGGSHKLEVVPTTGTVTHNGQPLGDLFLNFEPTTGRPSWAKTDAQGRFAAQYTSSRPGVLPGECRVWVMLKPRTVEEEQQLMDGTHPRAIELASLLKKYGRTASPLKLTITPGQGPLKLELD